MPLDLVDLFEGLDISTYEMVDLTEMLNQYEEPEKTEDLDDCVWVLSEEEWNSIPY